MQRYWIVVSVAGVVAAIGLAAGLDEGEGVFGQWPLAGNARRSVESRDPYVAHSTTPFSFWQSQR